MCRYKSEGWFDRAHPGAFDLPFLRLQRLPPPTTECCKRSVIPGMYHEVGVTVYLTEHQRQNRPSQRAKQLGSCPSLPPVSFRPSLSSTASADAPAKRLFPSPPSSTSPRALPAAERSAAETFGRGKAGQGKGQRRRRRLTIVSNVSYRNDNRFRSDKGLETRYSTTNNPIFTHHQEPRL